MLYELSNEKKTIVDSEKALFEEKSTTHYYEKTSNQYIGMLKTLFQDSPELYDNINNTGFYIRPLEIDMAYTMIRVPLLVEYAIPGNVVRPFVFAGLNNAFILKPAYSITYSTEFNTYDIPATFRKYHLGFTGGAGIRFFFKNNSYLSVRGDYEYRVPAAKLGYVLDYTTVNSFMFTVGYGTSLQ